MKKKSSHSSKGLAFRVLGIYIIVSLLYIFLSDYMVTSLFSDLQTIRTISTFKGWGFVFLSGAIIYWFIKQSQKKSFIIEERFQLFANLSFEGIVLHRKGIVLDANNAFSNYFGYPLKDVINKNLTDFFIKEEFIAPFSQNISSPNTEWCIIQANKKNGDPVWVQIISKLYEYNDENVNVIAIRDITNQINAEEKLKNNETFLRSIIENNPECIKILGPEGELKYMNPEGLKMIEVDDYTSVHGKCVYPMILEEHRQAFIDLTNRVFQGEQGTLQFQMEGLKGTKLWLETKAVPMYNSQGKIESSLGLTQNITERRKAENAIIDSERKLAAIFDGAPLIMFLVDEKSKITKINQTGIIIFDKTQQQVVGLKFGEVINCTLAFNDTDNCGNNGNCANCPLQNSILKTLNSKENYFKVEGKLSMGSQENVFERDVLISTVYLEIDNKPSVFVSIDDITERVQLENILKEKTSILNKAQELAKIGDFTYNPESNSFRLSPILEKITGSKKNLVTFDEIISSIHSDDKNEVKRIFKIVVAEQNRYSFIYRRHLQNGGIQHLFNQVECEKDSNGNLLKIFGVVMDITELKKAEQELLLKNFELRATEEELTASNDALKENLLELEEAKIKAEESDRLKSAFLANMSHEIRTPMNAIMGFSDLLDLEDMPFEKRKKFTKIIKDRSKDLMAIINDILDFSRIESHTLKIVETNGNINVKLIEIKDFFETRNDELYSKPITYNIFNKLTAEESYIETDFERIKQVLINLIDNAFKFTTEGIIRIGCQLKDKNNLQFFVSDTGIGISKDKQQIIFERFRQIEESYLTRDFGGAGLGLSICKGIIELMNGNIWVESELGIGSTFYFTIPYKPTRCKENLKEQVNTSTFNFQEKKILIVEDMIYNQDYLKEILEDTNASLLFAINGNSALEIFKSNSDIDLVLMDIRLPDIHGLDLTKQMIQERNSIKVIAQTAYATSEDIKICFEAGCIDFISKPISQKTLLEMLRKYII